MDLSRRLPYGPEPSRATAEDMKDLGIRLLASERGAQDGNPLQRSKDLTLEARCTQAT
jgi:hypothetical protein